MYLYQASLYLTFNLNGLIYVKKDAWSFFQLKGYNNLPYTLLNTNLMYIMFHFLCTVKIRGITIFYSIPLTGLYLIEQILEILALDKCIKWESVLSYNQHLLKSIIINCRYTQYTFEIIRFRWIFGKILIA